MFPIHYSLIVLQFDAKIAGIWAERSGVRLQAGTRNSFSFPKRRDRLWGPLSLLCNNYRGYFLGPKRLWRDLYHSPPSSAKVKNVWSFNSSPPPYVFMVWTGTSPFVPFDATYCELLTVVKQNVSDK
jgi:hypothetical protein